MAKILVVEDDRSLSDALAYNLRREDHTPIVVTDAVAAVEAARQADPDLILLDLMLPGGNGFEVCRQVRTFSPAPIIMLTARGEDIDRVLGLEIGADDYVVKPFNLRELLARIKANLRRVEMDQDRGEVQVLTHGALSVDTRSRTVRVQGRPLTLQPKEFDLLVYLMRNQGTVLTRAHLLQAVWGHEFVGERTVDVHVRRVRSKLEDAQAPKIIRTVHGVGYVFDAVERSDAVPAGSNGS